MATTENTQIINEEQYPDTRAEEIDMLMDAYGHLNTAVTYRQRKRYGLMYQEIQKARECLHVSPSYVHSEAENE